MIYGQNDKDVIVITQQSVATSATATGQVDTLGFNYATFRVLYNSSAAVSNKPAVIKIGEGDTSTAHSDITELVGGGTGGFTIPNANTASPQVYRFDLNLNGSRKRYLKASLTPAGAANIAAVVCTLSRAAEVPDSTTEQNVVAHVIV